MAKRHVLTPNEKRMVVKVYQFFTMEKAEGRGNGHQTRTNVIAATGVSKNTVASIWAEYNADNGTDFAAVSSIWLNCN
jgi:hypothetical protein